MKKYIPLILTTLLATAGIQAYTPKLINETDYAVMMKFPVHAAIDPQYILVPPHSTKSQKLFGANLSQGIKIKTVIIPIGETLKILEFNDQDPKMAQLSEIWRGRAGSFTWILQSETTTRPGVLTGTVVIDSVKLKLRREPKTGYPGGEVRTTDFIKLH